MNINDLYIIDPTTIKRIKVDKNDPYSAVSEWWYYAPIYGGMAVNRVILLPGMGLLKRSEIPLVAMKNDLYDEIQEVTTPPPGYVRCSVIFVADGVDEIEKQFIKGDNYDN